MNFNSLHFLIFLLVVLLIYWLLPHRGRWVLLLAASYYFYMSWNPMLVFLILGTTLVSYGAGIAISRTPKRGWKRFWLVATLIVCLGILVFFKYFDFLVQSVIDFLNLFSLKLDSFALNLILPVGISFYTFQTLSYVIDVYKGKFEAEYHFGYYALFVSYFPQLVAGPIERPGDLLPQLKSEHTLNGEDMFAGLRVFLYGFFLKCVVADYIGIFVNNVFMNLSAANSLSVLCAALLFVVQMFGDFAGYSFIATGTARMMGVRLTKNFDRPYLSASYTEFFRRWHITLTRWFTDYVYIPLGGNRKGKARRIVNTVIVFFLCGLWHGANWTYVLWGLYVALFINLEHAVKKPFGAFLSKHHINANGRTYLFFRRMIMWITLIPPSLTFRSASLAQMGEVFTVLFTRFGSFDSAMASLGLNGLSILVIVAAIVGMCLFGYFAEYEEGNEPPRSLKQEQTAYAQRVSVYFYAILAITIFWLMLLANSDLSSFLYFQF